MWRTARDILIILLYNNTAFLTCILIYIFCNIVMKHHEEIWLCVFFLYMWNPDLVKASVPLQRNSSDGHTDTSSLCRSLYRSQSQNVGTALQLFTRYHLLQHIPLLLISNQFLQGYLSTWRGWGAVSRYGIGSVPFLHCGYCQQGSIHA